MSHQFNLQGKAEALLHAARSFHFNTASLSPQTRRVVQHADFSRTELQAASDGSVKGVTVQQVDAALAKAGIKEFSQKIEIKMALRAQGIMRDFG